MSRSLDVQRNARGIMIVKGMHECHKHHVILHKLCTRFGKTNLDYIEKSKNFFYWGAAPSKYAHAT